MERDLLPRAVLPWAAGGTSCSFTLETLDVVMKWSARSDLPAATQPSLCSPLPATALIKYWKGNEDPPVWVEHLPSIGRAYYASGAWHLFFSQEKSPLRDLRAKISSRRLNEGSTSDKVSKYKKLGVSNIAKRCWDEEKKVSHFFEDVYMPKILLLRCP